MNYIEKRVLGTGAALNVELGFIPSFVEIWNEDRDVLWQAPLNTMIAFDGGGNTSDSSIELTPGMEIAETGDGDAYGVIEDIFLTSGSWAGGNAAGVIVLSLEGQGGTWTDNAVIGVRAQKGAPATGDYATVNGAAKGNVTKIDTQVRASAANETVVPYRGASGEEALGITIGSVISEDNKILIVRAFKHGQG